MAKYVAGDRESFVQLFARWGPRLRQMFVRQGMRADESDDLVQQTFLHLHRARADFRTGSALRPWLYTIAANLRRQALRRRGRKPEVGLDLAAAEPPAPASDPDAGLLGQQVRAALLRLPEAQREVIVLHWFEGLSFREVAAVLGSTTTAVKVRAHRGYSRLRAELEAVGVTAFAQVAYGNGE
jgi:RNA polymerase sigma-70 factor (ECF subfamily)